MRRESLLQLQHRLFDPSEIFLLVPNESFGNDFNFLRLEAPHAEETDFVGKEVGVGVTSEGVVDRKSIPSSQLLSRLPRPLDHHLDQSLGDRAQQRFWKFWTSTRSSLQSNWVGNTLP